MSDESRAEFEKFRWGKLWSPHEVKAAWAAWDAQEIRHTENTRELERGNEAFAALMDKVTMLVGRITGSDFGEHEFDNDPWQNAVAALEQLALKVVVSSDV